LTKATSALRKLHPDYIWVTQTKPPWDGLRSKTQEPDEEKEC
jgi:hypothetical protein